MPEEMRNVRVKASIAAGMAKVLVERLVSNPLRYLFCH
jgi:hypothetical protein